MLRVFALIYLLVGIALSAWIGLYLMAVVAQPDPLAPTVLNAMSVPGSFLTRSTGPDQPWMDLLVWAGSVLVNFGLLSWLADNLGE